MNNFLIPLVGLFVIANLFYNVWSYFLWKRLTSNSQATRIEDRLILENIIHTRSSFNVLYAALGFLLFVLTYFGFNIQKNVTAEVTKSISESASVDLEALARKARSVSLSDSVASEHLADIFRTRDQARVILDALKHNPQKLFVVQGLSVAKLKSRFFWSELNSADGARFPDFKTPPVILWCAFDPKDHAYYGTGVSTAGDGVTSTIQGIEVSVSDGPVLVDLWIYAK